MATLNGVPYRQMWLPQSKYGIKAPYSMVPKKLTLHETDNQMPADNEIKYMNSNNNQVSYHGAVDDKEYIQAIPYNRNAWHAGDGGNGYGNRNTIAMEICQNYDRSRQTTNLLEPLNTKYHKGVANAIKVGAQILLDNNIVANNDNIKTHNDWNGKHCPRKMRNDGQVMIVKAGIINEYNRLVGNGKHVTKPVQPESSAKADASLTFSQVVDKAIAGGYGNYPARVNNINNKTNYNYNDVQKEINKRFKVTTPVKPSNKPTAEQVANEIAFKKHNWGNNPERARKLRAEGYDATWIQNRINQLLKGGTTPKPAPKPQAKKIAEDGFGGRDTFSLLQSHFGLVVDGELWGQYEGNQATKAFNQNAVKYGKGGSPAVRELQKAIGMPKKDQDGIWGAATTRALQRYLGTPVDGIISRPSTAIKELQKRLNNGTF